MPTQILLADLKCKRDLDSEVVVLQFTKEVIRVSSLTLVDDLKVKSFTNGTTFGPGISCIGILMESHIAVHTAPDRHMLNLDLFSCKKLDINEIYIVIEQTFLIDAIHRWEVIDRS